MWSHILAIISLFNCFGTGHVWESDEISNQLNNLHSHQPHHRNKRFLWMTHEKRLVFPPGTQLVLTPTIAMPLMRYPPHGLDSNLTISTPFTISMDMMGMTDNENPIGLLPFLNPGFGIGAFGKRRKRSTNDPDIGPDKLAGGERVILYQAVEDFLFKFGMDGKSCLLRAICEMHESPLIGYGFFGEILELFLTPSFSPFVETINDYVSAEKAGLHEGECWRYFKDCPQSFFVTSERNKYSKEAQNIEDKVHATTTTTTTSSSVKKELPTTTYSDSDQV